MDKKQALQILIKHSSILSEEIKLKLLEKIDILNPNDIQTLGKFLALEKKQAIEENRKLLSEIDALLEKL